MKSLLVIIPARSGSKGVKDKNIKILGGIPLLAWPIKAINAAKVRNQSTVIVSTDSAAYLAIASEFGVDGASLRPERLSTDEASTSDVIGYHIEQEEKRGKLYEYVLVLEPTSPFTEARDIERAVFYLESNSDTDSVVGIGKVKDAHPVFLNKITSEGFLVPYLDKSGANVRRQDVEDLFFYDGSLYLSRVEAFKKNMSFYGPRTYGLEMDSYKNLEIDDSDDFELAQFVIRRRYED